MIHYRPFLNTDTPFIVDIWRQQKPMRAAVDSFDRTTLDTVVLAKPYFDREGLILALDDEKPLGFVHAGFAPRTDLSDLDFSRGVISQLKVIEFDGKVEVATELLRLAEEYLVAKGAKEARFGGYFPNAPFYLGLYGGAQLGGVLEEDDVTLSALEQGGYLEVGRIGAYTRTLAGFRTCVNREQMSIRRRFQISAIVDPIENSWWESCSFGLAERECFLAFPKNTEEQVGAVKFWDIQPLAKKWGVSARGVHHFEVSGEFADSGLRLFLLGEALRYLMQQRVGLVEVQAESTDLGTVECLQALGFERSVVTCVMSKTLP